MYYIVCKTDKEKRDALNQIVKINKFVYKEDNLEDIYKKLSFVNYDEVDDNIIESLEKEAPGELNNNLYFKFYDLDTKGKFDCAVKSLMDLLIYCKSGKNERNYCEIFYHSLGERLLDEYLGREHERTMLDEICDLGLITFSNRLDINKSNELMYSFLH